MSSPGRRLWLAGTSVVCAGLLAAPQASLGRGSASKRRRPPRPPRHRVGHRSHRQPAATVLRRPAWLDGVQITEYYPVPEAWFVGRQVSAPGLAGQYRIDWLYSVRGLPMEGDGIDLAGNRVHVATLADGGWTNADRQPTSATGTGSANGTPAWRAGGEYWLSDSQQLTFPLASGGWSNGRGVRHVAPHGITFAPGPSGPMRYYRSVAVDPHLIPLGSWVYLPAYRNVGGSNGWFLAQDTGGAITGRHVDVFRPPPPSSTDGGRSMQGQRAYVVPPGGHSRSGPKRPATPPPPPDTSSGSDGGGPGTTGPGGRASPTGGTTASG